jgi:dUTP pyrophosphatase
MKVSGSVPKRATSGSAGYDLAASVQVSIPPHSRGLVNTGVRMAIPEGLYGQIVIRSSLAMRGLRAEAGVIDSDYRGEIRIVLCNDTDETFPVNVGDRLAQIILIHIVTPELEVVDTLDETIRKDGGFGSTGT